MFCARCHQKIIGTPQKSDGNCYCSSCYTKVLEEIKKGQDDLVKIQELVCAEYGISDCPASVILSIKSLTRKGYKIGGLKATCIYCFKLKNKKPFNVEGVSLMLQDEYSNAKKYYQRIASNRKKNSEVNLDIPPQTIKISVDRQVKKKKMPFKMEDL